VRARWLLIAAAAIVVLPVAAQQEDSPTTLTGTLRKVRESGSITLAYRASSIPFSYLSPRGEPIGYSIDLCKLLVEAISDEIGRTLAIKWQPVTPESRIASVASGQSDLECGSTTSNLERRKLVAFSPTIFVSGTKLLVKKGSSIRSFRDLGGKKVVVTAGTTNEAAMREIARKFKLDFAVLTAADHAASFAMLTAGEVDAFATDDVLLYGLLAQNRRQADYVVTGEFLSYDPYAIMYRRDDPQMRQLVNDAFRALAEDGAVQRQYKRWFLGRLPSGERIDLPMSPQLDALVEDMASKVE